MGEARSQVQLTLMQGEPTLETIADKIGLSGCSLQRRLRDAGTRLTQRAREVRCYLAGHYMRQQQPVSEMALLLGYPNVSAFLPACRRGFGINPRQWRKNATPY